MKMTCNFLVVLTYIKKGKQVSAKNEEVSKTQPFGEFFMKSKVLNENNYER